MSALARSGARLRLPRSPRRVAFLVWSRGLGGGEVLLVNHLLHLDRRAFEPIVVASGEGRLARRLRELGIPVFILPLHEERRLAGRVSVPRPSTTWQLVRLLRRERVDLIHSFSLETRNYAHAASLLARLPLIHTSQDTWFGDTLRPLQWWALNHLPARVIATSDTVLRSLRVGTRLAERMAVKIPPGVDLERFRPGSADAIARVRAELGIAADAPLLGAVGRLNSAVKDFPTLFAAAQRIAARCPRARLLVVGDVELVSDDAASVKSQIAGTALEGRVVFTGHRDDVPRIVAALDVLISASPRESFGLVLAEAAACGRPVVSTRSGGAEEVVVDGLTGLLVPVGDPAALAAAVLAILADPGLAAAMGRAARRHAELHFDLLRMVRRIEAEYATALALRGRRTTRVGPRARGVAGELGTRS